MLSQTQLNIATDIEHWTTCCILNLNHTLYPATVCSENGGTRAQLLNCKLYVQNYPQDCFEVAPLSHMSLNDINISLQTSQLQNLHNCEIMAKTTSTAKRLHGCDQVDE